MLWMQFILYTDGKIETSKNYSTSMNKNCKKKPPKEFFYLHTLHIIRS